MRRGGECPPQGRGQGTTRACGRSAVNKYVSHLLRKGKTTRQRFLGSLYMMKYGLKRVIESAEKVQREQLEDLSQTDKN